MMTFRETDSQKMSLSFVVSGLNMVAQTSQVEEKISYCS